MYTHTAFVEATLTPWPNGNHPEQRRLLCSPMEAAVRLETIRFAGPLATQFTGPIAAQALMSSGSYPGALVLPNAGPQALYGGWLVLLGMLPSLLVLRRLAIGQFNAQPCGHTQAFRASESHPGLPALQTPPASLQRQLGSPIAVSPFWIYSWPLALHSYRLARLFG